MTAIGVGTEGGAKRGGGGGGDGCRSGDVDVEDVHCASQSRTISCADDAEMLDLLEIVSDFGGSQASSFAGSCGFELKADKTRGLELELDAPRTGFNRSRKNQPFEPALLSPCAPSSLPVSNGLSLDELRAEVRELSQILHDAHDDDFGEYSVDGTEGVDQRLDAAVGGRHSASYLAPKCGAALAPVPSWRENRSVVPSVRGHQRGPPHGQPHGHACGVEGGAGRGRAKQKGRGRVGCAAAMASASAVLRTNRRESEKRIGMVGH
eukprot:6190684-Pleurochrysis_carterae.AAC.1